MKILMATMGLDIGGAETHIVELAKELKLEKGFRVVSNCNAYAGQSVFHLHYHILGGEQLSLTMC